MPKNTHPQHTLQESSISEVLKQAYIETDYIVETEPRMTLKIGTANPALLTLHKKLRVNCSAFITAHNPFSKSASQEENNERMLQLVNELKNRSLGFLPGIGQHPSNDWPGEPSLLIFGLSLEAAKALGNKYEQNAILWIGVTGTPELILLK